MRFAEKATSIFMSVVLAAGLCPLPAFAQAGDSASNGAGLVAAPSLLETQDGEGGGFLDEGPVEKVELIHAGTYTLTEGLDGVEVNGVFRYNAPELQQGDQLVVTREGSWWSYGRPYVYDAEREAFISGAEVISLSEISFEFEEGSSLEPGEHMMKLTYEGASCYVSVTIVENPVVRIGYLLKNPILLTEEHEDFGDWMESADGKLYFVYKVDFQAGDQLRVTINENGYRDVYYTYGNDGDDSEDMFRSDEGIIDPSLVEIITGQTAESPWGLGEHEVTLRYKGRSCTVKADVVENPVSSIEFAPATPYRIVEETGGFWEDGEAGGYYAYPTPSFAEGDRLVVINPKGVASTYTYGYDESGAAVFTDGNVKIDPEDVQLSQEGRWALGMNKMLVQYGGRTCEVDVQIVSSPVKSISFKPSGGYYRLLVEDEDYGEWQDYSNGEGSYFTYDMPAFKDGDVLTVVAANGTSTSYRYQFNEKIEGDAFVAGNGSVISDDDVSFNSDQSESNVWGVGMHKISVTYMGRSCSVDVKVMEQASLSKATVTLPKSKYTYTGEKLKPVPVVKLGGETLIADSDYEVSYKNNLKVGTATVTVSGIDAFKGKATASFTIGAASIKGAKLVLAKSSLVYNGKVRKPIVQTVGGKKLKAGTDYTVKYSNAKSSKLGRYKVWVVGKGNYKGTSAKATYSIGLANPVKLKVKSPTVQAGKVAKGNQTVKASAAFSVKGNKGGKVTYAKVSGDEAISVSKTGKVTVAKGTSKGTHSVKVTATAAAKGKYAEASKTLKLKVKVK